MTTKYLLTTDEAERTNYFYQYIEMRLTEDICKMIWIEKEDTAYPLYKHIWAKFENYRYTAGRNLYHIDINHFFNSLDPHNKNKLISWYNTQMNDTSHN